MDLQQIAQMIVGGGRQFGQNVRRDVSQLQNNPQAFQQRQRDYISDPNRMMMVAGMASPVKPAQSITRSLPINRLAFNQDDFARAMGDVLEGNPQKTGQTALDILATEGEGGAYHVQDGLHRLAKAILAGDKKINAITDENAYRKLSELNSPRFLKDALGRFAGSRKR